MIDTENDNKFTQVEEKAKMPFPSHVTSPCPNGDVIPLAAEIVNTAMDKNNLLASAGNVHCFVRDHYVNVETGTYGIESLIVSILKENNAVFPADIGSNAKFRKSAIAFSMFAETVIGKVRETFGADRYPDSTIRSYLAVFMVSNNKVGKIKLTSSEDSARTCCKPRTKYFLIQSPTE